MNQMLSRILYRLAYFGPGGYTLRPAMHRMRGAKIGQHVWISQQVYIDEIHPEGVAIGDNSTIGLRTSIFTHFYWGPKRGGDSYQRVIIGPNTFVGPHCVILPGVTVGEGCVIRAGSVVSRNVPPHTLWGSPSAGPLAQVTVPLTPEHSYPEFVRGLRPFRGRR